jgi:hypothetical protein
MPQPKIASFFVTFFCTDAMASFVVPHIQRWALRHCKYFYICTAAGDTTQNPSSSADPCTAVHVVSIFHEPERAGVFCRNLFTRVLVAGICPNLTPSSFYRYGALQSLDKLAVFQSLPQATVIQSQLPKDPTVLLPYLCYPKRSLCMVQPTPSHSSHSESGSEQFCNDPDLNATCGDHTLSTNNTDAQPTGTEESRIIREENLVEKALAFSLHNMSDTSVRNDLPHVLSAMYQASGMRLHSDLITYGIPQTMSDEFSSRADDEFASRFSPFYFANLIGCSR